MEEKIFVILVGKGWYHSLNSLSDVYMEFLEYVTDELGTPVGVRLGYCKDDEDWPDMSDEVILRPYEKFNFNYRYIEITGPTDWHTERISYHVTLIPYADVPNEIRERLDAVGSCHI